MNILKKIMAKEGLNKTQMAERLEISKSYFSMIINGQHGISKNMAKKIHDTFGVPYEVLLSSKVQENETKLTGTDS